MPATFNWEQTVGTPPGTAEILGVSGNLVNFKSIDSIGTSGYAENPIPAGSNSYELWLRCEFSGTFNSIHDLRMWQSTDFSPNTGLVVKATGVQETYELPTNATSSIATSTIGTSSPDNPNVSIGGSLSSSLTTSGFTDYIVMQLQTTGSAPAGDTSLMTLSLSYIES